MKTISSERPGLGMLRTVALCLAGISGAATGPLLSAQENPGGNKSEAGPVPPALYACDFESLAPGKVPDEFLILDGAFTIRAEDGNKFLELPGAPVDSYGVLFGPVATNAVVVSGRVYGTNKGRRLPVFGLGLHGAGGLKLIIAPGKQVIEILKGDDVLAQAPYKWEGGKWTFLKLQLRSVEGGAWQAEGKAWSGDKGEPPAWLITHRGVSELSPGKAALWGSPISGTPIRFDDLRVVTLEK